MPTARSRTFDTRSNFTGTYQNIPLGSTTTRSLATGLNGTCNDVIGNFPNPNSLSITRLNRQYPGLVGTHVNAATGLVDKIMNNFPIGYHLGPTDPRGVFPALTTLDKSNYAWRALSEGNPSAPDMSLPTFVSEMKDIPSLVKNWYGMFIRGKKAYQALLRVEGGPGTGRRLSELLLQIPEIAASGHLTWRWAIAPFIRDVRKMADYGFLMMRRMAMLRALQNGKVIRTRVALGGSTQRIVQSGQILHSEGASLHGKRVTDYTQKVWATVQYKMPGGKLFPYIEAELLNKAHRLVYGITTHEALATAWELMPWSWFVDWFAGIGTVINATNNTLGLVHSGVSLMNYTHSESSIEVDPATSDSWVSLNGDYHESYERKERFNVSPVLPFAPTYLPVLTGKALSILGSLVVLQQQPARYLGPLLRTRRK